MQSTHQCGGLHVVLLNFGATRLRCVCLRGAEFGDMAEQTYHHDIVDHIPLKQRLRIRFFARINQVPLLVHFDFYSLGEASWITCISDLI